MIAKEKLITVDMVGQGDADRRAAAFQCSALDGTGRERGWDMPKTFTEG